MIKWMGSVKSIPSTPFLIRFFMAAIMVAKLISIEPKPIASSIRPIKAAKANKRKVFFIN